MDKRGIFITQFDLDRLNLLIAEKRATGGENAYLTELETELGQAEVVDSKDIPGDVITMNSKVRMEDAETGEEMIYSLVFPQDANIDEGKISVLAPIGTGMIGYKEGDIIEWPVPAGIRKIKILEILYQPEASGDFDL
ncbi:MAG: nucleoside diphosphate kinase regulator [Actinomycetota bacterium]|nr:nucleoside diphosphate kinase regulator [Actinomycetota bacterium]MDD5666265.1 nucleoside diphosphate kinase regulator [Actinomycetota bacterium]